MQFKNQTIGIKVNTYLNINEGFSEESFWKFSF